MATVTQVSQTDHKRGVVLAAVIGNWLEMFDFTVYGFFAVVIGKVFFPTGNATVSLLLSVAAFAIGFITRPLGSVILGVYADRNGRRAALTLTIMLMAIGTGIIAICPGYAQIGAAAPTLVVLARLLQGFSQGGEFGPATAMLIEQGDLKGRGLRASMQAASQGGAILTGAAIAYVVSAISTPDALQHWAWRIPFFIGMLIAPVGLYLRRRLPDHEDVMQHGSQKSVLPTLWRNHLRKTVLLTIVATGGTVSAYTLTFYMPTFAIHNLHLPMSLAMLIGVASGVTTLIFSPIFGRLSDHFRSRKMFLIIGRAGLLLMFFPLFLIIQKHPTIGTILALHTFMMMFYAMSGATEFAFMCELFPRAVRATGASIVNGISVCFFGGTAPLVNTWLIKVSGNPLAPAAYVSLLVAASIIATLLLKETAGRPETVA